MRMEEVDFISLLNRLAVVLGKTPEDWYSLESLERIEFNDNNFNRDRAVNINLELLQELISVFRDSIELQIYIGENPVFNLNTQLSEQILINLCRDTEGSPTVRLYFKIIKTRLAELYYGEIINSIKKPIQYYLYLNSDRLIGYLQNCNLEDLETLVWKNNKDATVLILIPESDTYFIGPRIAILGGQYINQENCSMLQKWPEKDITLADYAYRICRDNLKWQDSWLNFITPWHLFVLDKSQSSPNLLKVIQIHFGNIFLLYTADFTYNRSDEGNTVRVSRYSAPDRSVEVIHQSGAVIMEHFQNQTESKLILDWIYDLQWTTSDRMTLAQHNIVDQLNLTEENNRFLALFQKSETIKKNINWHWETFTQKNISIYMGLVKNLEDYLSDVVDKFSANVVTIQKTLTDTMLAAVAVWIGSFIASLFDKPFNPLIFQIGLIAYGLYVFCFPLLYTMIQQWKAYNSYQEQISVRKRRFLECLPTTKVESIWDEWKIEEIKKRFVSNFWWTIGIYILVILILLVIAIILPGWVIYSVTRLITPTPTP